MKKMKMASDPPPASPADDTARDREIAKEWLDSQGFDWVGTGTQKSGAIERQAAIESLSKLIASQRIAGEAAGMEKAALLAAREYEGLRICRLIRAAAIRKAQP